MPAPLPPDQVRRYDLTRRAAYVVLAAGIIAFFSVGSATVPRPTLLAPGAAVAAPGAPGFSEVAFTVTPGPALAAPARAGCALLADTDAARQQGLKGRHTLGRYAGMLFRFPAPTRDVFYMADTPLPLSIAWFDAAGRWISQTDMVPCPASAASCPYYGPPTAYVEALEVPRGGLGALGIGAGSVLHSGGPCLGA